MEQERMRKIIEDFSKTLDNKDKDEWWTTDRGAWNCFTAKFLKWYKINASKYDRPELRRCLQAFVSAYDNEEWPIENNVGLFQDARKVLREEQ